MWHTIVDEHATKEQRETLIALANGKHIQVEGDKIRAEHVYLDPQTVAEQLGLQPK